MPFSTTWICGLTMVVIRTSPLTREAYVVFYESRLQLINYVFAFASHCISYRYDDGSTDRSKDDWESKDGVMVFSPGDDAMGLLFS